MLIYKNLFPEDVFTEWCYMPLKQGSQDKPGPFVQILPWTMPWAGSEADLGRKPCGHCKLPHRGFIRDCMRKGS